MNRDGRPSFFMLIVKIAFNLKLEQLIEGARFVTK